MTTATHSYLISDLHLSPERPDIAKAFLTFMTERASSAEQLFILGDLFEYWIGDDAAQMVGAEPILQIMKAVSTNTRCYFIAGNRDFLVRQQFEQASGFKILADETTVDLYGTQTLLLHGDSLCTDDIEHQKFRASMTTNEEFCSQFLALPIPQRIETAKKARMASSEHKSQVTEGIMDVTTSAVERAFVEHNVTQMIHGHTHRQNTHDHNGNIRYVLGDWDKTTSVMTANSDGITIENTPI